MFVFSHLFTASKFIDDVNNSILTYTSCSITKCIPKCLAWVYNLTCIYRSSLLKSVHAGNWHLNSRCINNYPCVGATGLCGIINRTCIELLWFCMT